MTQLSMEAGDLIIQVYKENGDLSASVKAGLKDLLQNLPVSRGFVARIVVDQLVVIANQTKDSALDLVDQKLDSAESMECVLNILARAESDIIYLSDSASDKEEWPAYMKLSGGNYKHHFICPLMMSQTVQGFIALQTVDLISLSEVEKKYLVSVANAIATLTLCDVLKSRIVRESQSIPLYQKEG